MDDDPILFLPATFARHEEAVQAVQDEIRTRAPRPGGQRFPGSSPGAWGLLAAGASISAASGITLGTGSVKLCTSSGTPISPTTTVTVKNAGAAISAGGAAKIVALEWTAGDWSACGCGAGPCSPPTLAGNVKGCNAANLAGVAVEAHDATAGGTLLGATTTDAGGNYTLAGLAGAVAGNAIVVTFAYGATFVAASTTLAYTTNPSPSSTQWGCGKATTLASKTLAPAAGYGCCVSCNVPLPNTLFYTDALGTYTLTGVGAWGNNVYRNANPTSPVNTQSPPNCGTGLCTGSTTSPKYQASVRCITGGKLRIERFVPLQVCNSGLQYLVDPSCSNTAGDNFIVDIPITCGSAINITGTPVVPGTSKMPDPVGGPVTVTS